MKLFGRNKQDMTEPAVENTFKLEEEVMEEQLLSGPVMGVAEAAEETSHEEGYINSIAGTFGIPEEELNTDPAEVAAAVSGAFEAAKESVAAEKEMEKKKLTRAEKKAAKEAAKEAEKAAKEAAKEAAKAEKKAMKKAEKEAKKASGKWGWGKRIVFLLVLLAAFGIVGCSGYFVQDMWVHEETLDIYEANFANEILNISEVEVVDEVVAPGSTDENAEAIEFDSKRKKGCYTFLVAARDVASGCTDVIITGMFDTVNGTINMVSIPRDTLINKGLLKVNTAYQGDLAAGGNGVDGLLKEMKKILGYDVDSYAVVDVTAVEKLIDAVGGVYFDVPKDMHYVDESQGLVIDLDAGYQKLSGSDAVKMLRFRKGYANQDLGRIETQHNFIMAMAKQMLDIGNIPNLGAVLDIYQEHVQSNLSAGNILFYAKNFLQMDFNNIQFVDMPQMKGAVVEGQSLIFINPTKWVKVINEYLNPYKDDIKQGNLNIKFSADEGKTFYYTGGGK